MTQPNSGSYLKLSTDGREAVLPKFIGRRLLRHAVWYLRSRRRDTNDFQAARLLLVCLRKSLKETL